MIRLFETLTSLRPRNKNIADLERWSKIEYGKDWAFAYHYILDTGKAPMRGEY